MARLNKNRISILFTLAIFPDLAQANAGVPMIFLVMPAMALSIIPIIIIEAIYLSKKLSLSGKDSAKTVTISNLASTIVGIPCYMDAISSNSNDYRRGFFLRSKYSIN